MTAKEQVQLQARVDVNDASDAAAGALIHRQEELIASAATIALLQDPKAAPPAVPKITVVVDKQLAGQITILIFLSSRIQVGYTLLAAA